MRLPSEPIVNHDTGDEDERKPIWERVRVTVGAAHVFEYDPDGLKRGAEALHHLGRVLDVLDHLEEGSVDGGMLALRLALQREVLDAWSWYREQK